MRHLALVALLAACHPDGESKPGADPDAPAGPCADGSWSGWSTAEAALQVATWGNDELGDGTAEHPYGTLAGALHRASTAAPITLALGPGTFPGNVAVTAGRGLDVTIQGCSTGETEIVGVAESGKYDEAIVLGGHAGEGNVDRLTLRHLSVTGNGPGVVARKQSALTLADVRLHDLHRYAVSAIGYDTTLTLRDVVIDTVGKGAYRGLVGWGVLVTGATATLERVTITGTRAMGLYQKGGRLTATDLTVEGVLDTSGQGLKRRGFGVHVDDAESVTLERCTIRRVAGGGIVLADVASSTLTSCTVDGVDEASVEPGDGVVIAHRRDGTLTATLTDVTVTGARRMGVVLAGVTATLSGVTAGADNGLSEGGNSIYADPLAVVTGATTVPFDRAELRLLRASGAEAGNAGRRAP